MGYRTRIETGTLLKGIKGKSGPSEGMISLIEGD